MSEEPTENAVISENKIESHDVIREEAELPVREGAVNNIDAVNSPSGRSVRFRTRLPAATAPSMVDFAPEVLAMHDVDEEEDVEGGGGDGHKHGESVFDWLCSAAALAISLIGSVFSVAMNAFIMVKFTVGRSKFSRFR